MTSNQKLSTFYIIILTQTFSLIGSRISGLAIGFHIFNETKEATPLTLVAFFSVLPMVVASSLSGVLADRWDRRFVMILADAGQALGTLLLLISFASGSFQLWHLYTVVLLQSIFGVFQGPAFQASVTMLVPESHRDRANAIQQLTGPLSGIIAPAVAGLVYGLFGVIGAIGFDLMTFLVAILVIFLVRIPRPIQTSEGQRMAGSIWKEMLGGFRYLAERPVLLGTLLYMSVVNFLLVSGMALQTPYLLGRTGSEETMGIILSVMNAGGLLGGIIISVWGGTRPRIHTIMIGIAIAGLAFATFGLVRSPVAMGAALFILMMPLPMANALFMSIMQSKVAPDIQGRVFAVLTQVSMVLTPVSYLITGPLVDQVITPQLTQPAWQGIAPIFGTDAGAPSAVVIVICGTFVALISLAAYALPAIRRMESTLPEYVVDDDINREKEVVPAFAEAMA
jgi:MFS transporter, DHA3 family, macrolide efflux protein